MIWLKPARVQLGSDPSDKDRQPDELDRRSVQIATGFWLDAFEVTNEKYRAFVLAVPKWQKGAANPNLPDNAADYLRHWTGPASFAAGTDRQPVTWINFFAAQAYCEWAGKRLPSDDEWEYAARAQTLTPYWWGGTMDPARANNGATLKDVGDPQTRNEWGFYDILGNAREFTRDGWLRGGSINRKAAFLRVANRVRPESPRFANVDYGFRCAR
jgi:formylglycine-generating enzyme required for sulfatase activity